MATAALLGAAPTLTSSLAGPPPVLAVGAVAQDIDNLSLHRKRSTQTKYLNSMTDYTLHVWPNGSVTGVRMLDNSTKKYGKHKSINNNEHGEEYVPRPMCSVSVQCRKPALGLPRLRQLQHLSECQRQVVLTYTGIYCNF